ncbi:uncharacterized protein LOC113768807 [Coffea eugenioides]|uniref:uncharacterized protein LOC113768807 n=1 Tax=Coffea eugenioides TaxID=49369 RepID=UPI000F6115DC|nr:uncharacterized protein LOC113768807 [Coffea eugenioides]
MDDGDELLPWEGQKSDSEEEDKSSAYSSCGESEFERYCSANSAMGTPSVSGSSVYEFADSEFGSLKSFKLGGENRNLKNLGVGMKLSCFSSDPGTASSSSHSRNGFFDGKKRSDEEHFDGFLGMSEGMDLYEDSDVLVNNNEVGLVGNDEMGIMGNQDSWGNQGIHEDVNRVSNDGNLIRLGVSRGSSGDIGEGSEVVNGNQEEEFRSSRGVELVDGCLEGSGSTSKSESYGGHDGRCSDEDESSSRYEHSEGEDSMSGGGSDGGTKADLYSMNNVQYSSREGISKNENELFMTSAVAFGSDDWDDFMQETRGNVVNTMVHDGYRDEKQQIAGNEIDYLDSASANSTGHFVSGYREQEEEVVDIPRTNHQIYDNGESSESVNASSSHTSDMKFDKAEQGDGKGVSDEDYQISCANGLDQGSLTKENPRGITLGMQNPEMEEVHQCANKGEVTSNLDDFVLEQVKLEERNLVCDPLSHNVDNQSFSLSRKNTEDRKDKSFMENNTCSSSLPAENETNGFMENPPVLFNHFEDHFSTVKRGNCKEFYDEMVHDMEEILLDTGKSHGAQLTQGRTAFQPQIPVPSRDGGSTASTSGTDDAYPLIHLPLRIDGLEVVGARQKQGDVSFSERLVGVKKYTVYIIRAWNGEETWEVERRYRDFYALYHQLKKLFADQGLILPPPWSSVDRESRKIFGNASPDVIAERSVLIQECLQSVIDFNISSSTLNPLIRFLYPSKAIPSSPLNATPLSQSQLPAKGSDLENASMLGSTISLVVQVWPHKSVKQMLDAQHNICAGCHKNFDEGKNRMKELVQTLGWGKPRLCEYSGQLFCSSCHSNDTAVLPARVLHLWDFAEYPVSQLAKSYLDSILDKPMLCVSAVNPFLFSRVPALQHVTNVRKKIGAMLPYVRCPFRGSINKGLGSRRYLLESNDFFALRDLIDLSKGMFAALPVIVETVSKKIQEHIIEQCLICCDSGIPCNARQACNDPSSLIFPFQGGEVERCRSCDSVFHSHCFRRIETCPCGARLKPEEAKGITAGIRRGFVSDMFRTLKSADASDGFLSGLFSKATPQMSQGHKEGPKDKNTVILMGSLPSTSL